MRKKEMKTANNNINLIPHNYCNIHVLREEYYIMHGLASNYY